MRAMMIAGLLGALTGCVGGGSGGGDGDGLPWVPCSPVEGEAPCCPRIDVETLCLDDETYEQSSAVGASAACIRADGRVTLVAAGVGEYVEFVNALDARLGWQGIMRCTEDGLVRHFEADAGDGLARCEAACFTADGVCSSAPKCPELNPFPLDADGFSEQALQAAIWGDQQPPAEPADAGDAG